MSDVEQKSQKNKTKKRKSDVLEVVKGYNPDTDSWHCTICGQDMGKQNPRQYCMKTYCPYE